MPLEGDLKSLNLSSVLQLIAHENLTGVLKIKRKNEVVNIGILDSQITGAFYERGDKADRLENYLVRSGLIKKNLFDMIQEIHQETKRPIMTIIIEDQYLTMEQIQRIIAFKIQEVIDEVFTWLDGAFKFEPGSVIYPRSMLKVRMNIESMVLEAARRSDEWPKIKKAIPSADLVYKKIEKPELKLKLTEDQERLINMLDGSRCVDDLAEISGLGRFQTYYNLHHLVTTGQIELSYAKPRVEQKGPKTKISLRVLRVPALVVILATALLVEYFIGNRIAPTFLPDFSILPVNSQLPDYQDYQQIFFHRYNRFPTVTEVQAIFEK